jgi:hypothetical protein
MLSIVLLLGACRTPQTPSPEESQSSASRAMSSVAIRVSSIDLQPETRNVSYEGVVEPAGISIYMEGTHRLLLDDGRFLLLESERTDLNGYVGERARVVGAVRPTVEGDSLILRVDQISLLSLRSSSSSESSPSSSSPSSMHSEATSSSPPAQPSVSSVVPEVGQSSAATSAAPSSETTTPPTSDGGAELQGRIELMAAEDLSAARWTQRYCTAHIGFCIPVHKNWWFTSFGATTSYYWHVEIGPEPIENLGDGPLQVNLVEGSLSATGAADASVRTEGSTAVGYREWTGNRHFEIRGDLRLEAAIRYITERLESYAPPGT